MSIAGPLIDRFGRLHTDLRVSVTDRCNIRCLYCMPAEGVLFRPHAEILSFEEIERFVRVAARLGIRKVRLTGGEPLVRKGICRLVRMVAAVPGIDDLAMTTNGILLDQYAELLKVAGLQRVNVSLDTLDPGQFSRISRRDELARVLAGIEAACRAGFRQIKLNVVALRGQTEAEVVPLARFARKHGLELRFIEFMPLDADERWTGESVLSGGEILALLADGIGPLEPVSEPESRAPATRYRFVGGGGSIGLICTVSRPFCDRCGRLRLTADGNLRNCLFSTAHWDVRALVRSGASDEQLATLIHDAVCGKKERHGSDAGELASTDCPMYQIGG